MDTSRTHGYVSLDGFWANLAVGQRVMVRRRLTGSERAALAGTLDERASVTDVLGEVVEFSDAAVTVQTRDELVQVSRADAVTGKAIPPRPVRKQRRTEPR